MQGVILQSDSQIVGVRLTEYVSVVCIVKRFSMREDKEKVGVASGNNIFPLNPLLHGLLATYLNHLRTA